ncbi:hypothetical protein MP228_007036 [Amoeboaphelidium protococcarum]|nr:hypothetical protein MP228_007036 [Amoeboaphelidium protococcarum]
MSGMPSQQLEWPVTRVRQTFIDFFKVKYQHKFVPSSSTIPHDDPTLLFANAGMNQFKPIFLGTADPNSEMSKMKSAVNSQKCIRAGGKHNDLEDVGKDVYHHTFFEMMGNWSFGDYFKKEAIQMAWELLTVEYKLPKDRLYVTYFGGDEKLGLKADLESKKLWLDIGLPESRILPFGAKENFWEMGDVGPCGSCSEIHFDRIGNRDAAHRVNRDDPDVLEIWNLVFMEFNREADGNLRSLPAKHVDTGLGLERVASVLQNKSSNYDTDAFMPIFAKIQQVTQSREYSGKVGAADVDGIDMAYRVVADHARTLTIAIADGGIPSNEGRGYVLRRILRRGVRYARRRFNAEMGNFFPQLVDTVAGTLGQTYPEVLARLDLIKEILGEEEIAFVNTLDRGERLFENILSRTTQSGSKVLSGKDAFKLYDTFGFPVDLTRLMAAESGVSIDEEAFAVEQAKAKEASKAKKNKNGSARPTLDVHLISRLEKEMLIPKTNDDAKYSFGNCNGRILALVDQDKQIVGKVVFNDNSQSLYGILLDKTNFYAESGGQEADIGVIAVDADQKGGQEAAFDVEDVQVYAGYVLHIGSMKYGQLSVGDNVISTYNEDRRFRLRNNHSGTHLLNYALRSVIGEDIDQKGSLVAQDKLRFDFSARSGLNVQQMAKVEEIVNGFVKKNYKAYSMPVALETAKSIRGLRAVFGEQYPDPVRVVAVNVPIEELVADPQNSKWDETAIEFCGGTHVAKTGDIREFAIVEESSISKGVRRIVAITGDEALEAGRLAGELEQKLDEVEKLRLNDANLKDFKSLLDASVISAVKKSQISDRLTLLLKKVSDAAKSQMATAVKELSDQVMSELEESKDAKFYVKSLAGVDSKVLLGVVKQLSTKVDDKSILFLNTDSQAGRVSYNALVPKAQVSDKFNAQIWAESVAKVLDGKMGGKPQSAQGSGTKVGAVDEAISVANELAKLKL